jgi:hypothetical protein
LHATASNVTDTVVAAGPARAGSRTVNFIAGHPRSRHAGIQGINDHSLGQLGFGSELDIVRHTGGPVPQRVIDPGLRQIQLRPIDGGGAFLEVPGFNNEHNVGVAERAGDVVTQIGSDARESMFCSR